METKSSKMLPQYYETEIINSKRFSHNIALLELRLPDNSEFNFKAGQFVLVYQTIGNKEENRAFSICSSPSQKTIDLLIRKYENGKISPLLFNLKKGDKLKIRGPFGMFTVKTPQSEEIVFTAAGTGIAPLRSMIHEILEKNHEKKVTLIFGFRHESDYFFEEEFEKLQENHKNFKIHPCATQPKGEWKHYTGRITSLFPKFINSPENKEVYICGPNQMINDTLNVLIKEMNFKKEQTRIERWGTK